MILAQSRRHPMRPAHVRALIHKPGFKVQTAQVYASDDPHLDSDVQFGVTRTLVGDFQRHEEPHPTQAVDGRRYSLDYTFVLEPGSQYCRVRR